MPTPPHDIPTDEASFHAFDGPWLRILRPKGACLIVGKVLRETPASYRVVFLSGGQVRQAYYRKSDAVHFDPCPYCPDATG